MLPIPTSRALATRISKTALTTGHAIAPCVSRVAAPSSLSPLMAIHHHHSSSARRSFTQSATMSRPEHKMQYFPKMTSEYPAKSHEFRRVLWTGESSQLVEMTIPVGGEIGEEVHHVDQHLLFTQGQAKAVVAGEERTVNAGDLVIVPQGTKHNFINIAQEPLIVATIYAPAEHNPKSVHKTKEEGDKLEEEGKDEPPSWAKPKA